MSAGSIDIVFGIGDFAALGRVSVRMLRHYDAIGLLRPARTDPVTGYRYYEADQLRRLNRVIALKDLGLTLEQVADILDDRSTSRRCTACSGCAGHNWSGSSRQTPRGSRVSRRGCA